MADPAEQRAWVMRVLGIDMPPAAAPVAAKTAVPPVAPPKKRLPPLLPIWRDAKEEVDAGIGKLQDALRAAADDDLQAIAEYGLYGATQGQSVRLVAALMDADGDASPDALQDVLDAVEDFRDFLDVSPIVDLIENNPFGVSVPLRQTLGQALSELERQAAA